jgi:hypothetical protein
VLVATACTGDAREAQVELSRDEPLLIGRAEPAIVGDDCLAGGTEGGGGGERESSWS